MGSTRNVLLVANYGPDAGYAWWLMENFWLQVQDMAASRGGQCLLVYPHPGTIPQCIANSSMEVAVHNFGDRSFRNLAHLRHLIRTRKIGSIYLTDRRHYDWVYLLSRLWGIRRIILHNHIPGERPQPSVLRLAIKRLIHGLRLFSCDVYIGVSRFVARRMIAVGGVPRRRVTYVHNGVAPPTDAVADDRIRDRVGVGPEGVLVVNVGRAHHYKGIDFMVDVAEELTRRIPANVGFVHVGDGPHLSEFMERAMSRGLGDRFYFAGRRRDVSSILLASDIAFHSSRGEAFSLAVLEYMFAGLAVMAPDHCGNGEAIEDGVDGLLYEPQNLEDAVGKLADLAQRPELRAQLGEAARAKAQARFSLEMCNRVFRQVMEAALFSERPPTFGDPE